jgi:Protein of unknown function (DUF2505)
VRFEVVQSISAPREAVLLAVVDPRLYESMGSTKGLAPPTVLACDDDGDLAVLRIRYRFEGNLSRAVRAVLDPEKMTWVVELKVKRSKYRAKFRMLPDHYPDRIECAGTYRFEEDGAGTEQIIKGDLVVHAPLFAGAVERSILGGLRDHMVEEAEALEKFVG